MRIIPTKYNIADSNLPAVEFNELASEIKNVISNTGISFSSSDLSQFTRAMKRFMAVAAYYTDSGAANQIILLNSYPEFTENYFHGMEVRFLKAVSNTGAACTIKVGANGRTIPLLNALLSTPVINSMGSGDYIVAYYNITLDSFVICRNLSSTLTGPQGLAGARGNTGETGPTGGTGLIGPAGLPGAIGPQGPAGNAGTAEFGPNVLITTNTILDSSYNNKTIYATVSALGDITITLPPTTSISYGARIMVSIYNATAGAYGVIIAAAGSETIGNVPSIPMFISGSSITLIRSTTSWIVRSIEENGALAQYTYSSGLNSGSAVLWSNTGSINWLVSNTRQQPRIPGLYMVGDVENIAQSGFNGFGAPNYDSKGLAYMNGNTALSVSPIQYFNGTTDYLEYRLTPTTGAYRGAGSPAYLAADFANYTTTLTLLTRTL